MFDSRDNISGPGDTEPTDARALSLAQDMSLLAASWDPLSKALAHSVVAKCAETPALAPVAFGCCIQEIRAAACADLLPLFNTYAALSCLSPECRTEASCRIELVLSERPRNDRFEALASLCQIMRTPHDSESCISERGALGVMVDALADNTDPDIMIPCFARTLETLVSPNPELLETLSADLRRTLQETAMQTPDVDRALRRTYCLALAMGELAAKAPDIRRALIADLIEMMDPHAQTTITATAGAIAEIMKAVPGVESEMREAFEASIAAPECGKKAGALIGLAWSSALSGVRLKYFCAILNGWRAAPLQPGIIAAAAFAVGQIARRSERRGKELFSLGAHGILQDFVEGNCDPAFNDEQTLAARESAFDAILQIYERLRQTRGRDGAIMLINTMDVFFLPLETSRISEALLRETGSMNLNTILIESLAHSLQHAPQRIPPLLEITKALFGHPDERLEPDEVDEFSALFSATRRASPRYSELLEDLEAEMRRNLVNAEDERRLRTALGDWAADPAMDWPDIEPGQI